MDEKIKTKGRKNWAWQPYVMTVGKLITELSKYNDDIPIEICTNGRGCYFVENIKLQDDWLKLCGS